jgi:hypothetical protein
MLPEAMIPIRIGDVVILRREDAEGSQIAQAVAF